MHFLLSINDSKHFIAPRLAQISFLLNLKFSFPKKPFNQGTQGISEMLMSKYTLGQKSNLFIIN